MDREQENIGKKCQQLLSVFIVYLVFYPTHTQKKIKLFFCNLNDIIKKVIEEVKSI